MLQAGTIRAAAGVQGLFLVLTMHSPLGSVIRCILWTISWRLLMDDAIKWAHSADEWNQKAEVEVWNKDFRDVHYYMLRALIAYLLFEVASLLRQTASSYVAVRFHHKKFFHTMQVSPTSPPRDSPANPSIPPSHFRSHMRRRTSWQCIHFPTQHCHFDRSSILGLLRLWRH